MSKKINDLKILLKSKKYAAEYSYFEKNIIPLYNKYNLEKTAFYKSAFDNMLKRHLIANNEYPTDLRSFLIVVVAGVNSYYKGGRSIESLKGMSVRKKDENGNIVRDENGKPVKEIEPNAYSVRTAEMLYPHYFDGEISRDEIIAAIKDIIGEQESGKDITPNVGPAPKEVIKKERQGGTVPPTVPEDKSLITPEGGSTTPEGGSTQTDRPSDQQDGSPEVPGGPETEQSQTSTTSPDGTPIESNQEADRTYLEQLANEFKTTYHKLINGNFILAKEKNETRVSFKGLLQEIERNFEDANAEYSEKFNEDAKDNSIIEETEAYFAKDYKRYLDDGWIRQAIEVIKKAIMSDFGSKISDAKAQIAINKLLKDVKVPVQDLDENIQGTVEAYLDNIVTELANVVDKGYVNLINKIKEDQLNQDDINIIARNMELFLEILIVKIETDIVSDMTAEEIEMWTDYEREFIEGEIGEDALRKFYEEREGLNKEDDDLDEALDVDKPLSERDDTPKVGDRYRANTDEINGFNKDEIYVINIVYTESKEVGFVDDEGVEIFAPALSFEELKANFTKLDSDKDSDEDDAIPKVGDRYRADTATAVEFEAGKIYEITEVFEDRKMVEFDTDLFDKSYVSFEDLKTQFTKIDDNTNEELEWGQLELSEDDSDFDSDEDRDPFDWQQIELDSEDDSVTQVDPNSGREYKTGNPPIKGRTPPLTEDELDVMPEVGDKYKAIVDDGDQIKKDETYTIESVNKEFEYVNIKRDSNDFVALGFSFEDLNKKFVRIEGDTPAAEVTYNSPSDTRVEMLKAKTLNEFERPYKAQFEFDLVKAFNQNWDIQIDPKIGELIMKYQNNIITDITKADLTGVSKLLVFFDDKGNIFRDKDSYLDLTEHFESLLLKAMGIESDLPLAGPETELDTSRVETGNPPIVEGELPQKDAEELAKAEEIIADYNTEIQSGKKVEYYDYEVKTLNVNKLEIAESSDSPFNNVVKISAFGEAGFVELQINQFVNNHEAFLTVVEPVELTQALLLSIEDLKDLLNQTELYRGKSEEEMGKELISTSILDLEQPEGSNFILNPDKLRALENFRNIRVLVLNNTGLTSIPPTIYNMTNLEALSLRDNDLDDSSSEDLRRLTNLEFLDIEGNKFTSAPNLKNDIRVYNYAYQQGGEISVEQPEERDSDEPLEFFQDKPIAQLPARIEQAPITGDEDEMMSYTEYQEASAKANIKNKIKSLVAADSLEKYEEIYNELCTLTGKRNEWPTVRQAISQVNEIVRNYNKNKTEENKKEAIKNFKIIVSSPRVGVWNYISSFGAERGSDNKSRHHSTLIFLLASYFYSSLDLKRPDLLLTTTEMSLLEDKSDQNIFEIMNPENNQSETSIAQSDTQNALANELLSYIKEEDRQDAMNDLDFAQRAIYNGMKSYASSKNDVDIKTPVDGFIDVIRKYEQCCIDDENKLKYNSVVSRFLNKAFEITIDAQGNVDISGFLAKIEAYLASRPQSQEEQPVEIYTGEKLDQAVESLTQEEVSALPLFSESEEASTALLPSSGPSYETYQRKMMLDGVMKSQLRKEHIKNFIRQKIMSAKNPGVAKRTITGNITKIINGTTAWKDLKMMLSGFSIDDLKELKEFAKGFSPNPNSPTKKSKLYRKRRIKKLGFSI